MRHAHEFARISKLADIDESTRGTRIMVGQNSMIDSFVCIKCAGGTEDVVIRERCFINPGTVMYSGNGIRIGNEVVIAANCTFSLVNHPDQCGQSTVRDHGFLPGQGRFASENDVWIRVRRGVSDGSLIHQGVVVGACSLVRRELPEFGIYAGVPTCRRGDRS